MIIRTLSTQLDRFEEFAHPSAKRRVFSGAQGRYARLRRCPDELYDACDPAGVDTSPMAGAKEKRVLVISPVRLAKIPSTSVFSELTLGTIHGLKVALHR